MRNRLAGLAVTAVAAGMTLAGAAAWPAGAAAAPAAVTAPARAGHLGNARQIDNLSQLNTGNGAAITQVSCPPQAAPGNCTAAGTYNDGTIDRAFISNERNGRWGPAMPVPMPLPSGDTLTEVQVGSLSCGAPGSCIVSGVFTFTPDRTLIGYYAEEKDGAFQLAASTSGGDTGSIVSGVSCASAANCTVAGLTFTATTPDTAFLWDEVNGSWSGLPQPVKGLAGLHAASSSIAALSCQPLHPGNCTAVGAFGAGTNPDQPFVVDERTGSWGSAQPVPDNAALNASGLEATAIACAGQGDCAIGGTYIDGQRQTQLFVADEAGGTVHAPQQVPGTQALNTGADGAWLNSVSCATAGNCVATGFYSDASNVHHAFVADERNGSWRPAQPLAGTGALATGTTGTRAEAESVFCATPGNCVVGGWLSTPGTGQQAFTASETNGGWGKATVVPGSAALNTHRDATVWAVSCAAAGSCAIGGAYSTGAATGSAFIADSSPVTRTQLGLSAGKIRFGHERAERISVKVTGRTGGTPGGKVTVKAGKTTVCVIKLAAAKGSCVLAARALKPGSYRLTARYGGDASYAAATSTVKLLRVTR